MRIRKLSLFIFILLLGSCLSQKYVSETIDQWETIEIDELTAPIHKMDGIGNLIWATDYGDGNLFRSKDGGNTWEKGVQFKSEYVERIQFINEKTGYVSGDYGYVYKSEDGGNTWTEISPIIENRLTERFRQDTTKNQKPDGIFAAYYGMYFKDSKEGFISGYQYNPREGFKTFTKLLFHTKDGGTNWIEIPKEERKNFLHHFIESLNPSYEEIESVYYFDKDKTATIQKNENDQRIFEKKSPLVAMNLEAILPPNGFEKGMLRNTVFLNSERGFLFGGSLEEGNELAIIYETKDGGKTWEYINADLPHIHESKIIGDYLWITGKKGLVKKRSVKKWLKRPRGI